MKKHRIIIAGSRSCPEVSDELYAKVLKYLINLDPKEVEFVSGGAKGADTFGEWVAYNFYGCPVKRFLPDYKTWGKVAPLRRNTEMAEYGTHLIALWDQESRGTADMIAKAKGKGLTIRIIKI